MAFWQAQATSSKYKHLVATMAATQTAPAPEMNISSFNEKLCRRYDVRFN